MSRLRIGHCPRRAWSGAFFCLQNSNPKLFRSPKIGKRCFFAVPKRLGSRNAAGRTRVFTLGIPLPACHRAAQRRQAASTRRDGLDRPPTLLGPPCPFERRLADEYDAAQAAGQIERPGGNRSIIPNENNAPAKVAETGLTPKQVHDARQFRDAEARDPVLSEGTSMMKVPFGRGASRNQTHAQTQTAPSFSGARSIVEKRQISVISGNADSKRLRAKGLTLLGVCPVP